MARRANFCIRAIKTVYVCTVNIVIRDGVLLLAPSALAKPKPVVVDGRAAIGAGSRSGRRSAHGQAETLQNAASDAAHNAPATAILLLLLALFALDGDSECWRQRRRRR